MEIEGYAVPILAHGRTREEAEKQARRDIMAFQVERLKLEQEAQSDVSQMASKINAAKLPKISD